MVDLPRKKVGIIACSGEELPEGTITRLAALKVLQELRPEDTVTICLPLFLAGGEGDRSFARFYPTIALDGCSERCAARATEKYSGKPAASIVIEELISENSLDRPQGRRRLDEAGRKAVEIASLHTARLVDDLLQVHWNRRSGIVIENQLPIQVQAAGEPATCACGSGIPVQKVTVAGEQVILAGLPAILQQFYEAGKPADEATGKELLDTVRIYNPIPAEAEAEYQDVLQAEYEQYCRTREEAQ